MDIIRAGVIMAAYLFVIVTLYLFLSSPFDDMMDSFDNINMTASDSKVESATSVGRDVFNMVFVALGGVPILWFIVWVFKREPDWGYEQ